MFNPADFRRVARDSGLTKAELAHLYGVSRPTVYGWLGEAPPREGSILARQAEVITAALITSIERKILPLAAMDTAKRRVRIDNMRRTLQGLKPAPV